MEEIFWSVTERKFRGNEVCFESLNLKEIDSTTYYFKDKEVAKTYMKKRFKELFDRVDNEVGSIFDEDAYEEGRPYCCFYYENNTTGKPEGYYLRMDPHKFEA